MNIGWVTNKKHRKHRERKLVCLHCESNRRRRRSCRKKKRDESEDEFNNLLDSTRNERGEKHGRNECGDEDRNGKWRKIRASQISESQLDEARLPFVALYNQPHLGEMCKYTTGKNCRIHNSLCIKNGRIADEQYRSLTVVVYHFQQFFVAKLPLESFYYSKIIKIISWRFLIARRPSTLEPHSSWATL